MLTILVRSLALLLGRINIAGRQIKVFNSILTSFQFPMNRPVTMIQKTVPTIFGGCLKVGGLIGFIKIFYAILTFGNK